MERSRFRQNGRVSSGMGYGKNTYTGKQNQEYGQMGITGTPRCSCEIKYQENYRTVNDSIALIRLELRSLNSMSDNRIPADTTSRIYITGVV